MKVHLTPCGTSILDNLRPRIQVGPLADVVALRNVDAPVSQLLTRAHDLFEAHEGLRDVLGEAAKQPFGRLLPDSAEVSAVLRTFGNGDRVVLLSSDSVEGATSAVLDAQLLAVRLAHLGLPDSVAVWATEPPNGANQPTRGPVGAGVHVLLLSGLDPTTAADLHRGVSSMLRAIIAVRNQRGELLGEVQPEWLLHLSGGYKALLPYSLAVVGLLASLLGPVRADVHFEGGELIPVPVLRAEAALWLEAARAFDPMIDVGVNAALYDEMHEPTPICEALRQPGLANLL